MHPPKIFSDDDNGFLLHTSSAGSHSTVACRNQVASSREPQAAPTTSGTLSVPSASSTTVSISGVSRFPASTLLEPNPGGFRVRRISLQPSLPIGQFATTGRIVGKSVLCDLHKNHQSKADVQRLMATASPVDTRPNVAFTQPIPPLVSANDIIKPKRPSSIIDIRSSNFPSVPYSHHGSVRTPGGFSNSSLLVANGHECFPSSLASSGSNNEDGFGPSCGCCGAGRKVCGQSRTTSKQPLTAALVKSNSIQPTKPCVQGGLEAAAANCSNCCSPLASPSAKPLTNRSPTFKRLSIKQHQVNAGMVSLSLVGVGSAVLAVLSLQLLLALRNSLFDSVELLSATKVLTTDLAACLVSVSLTFSIASLFTVLVQLYSSLRLIRLAPESLIRVFLYWRQGVYLRLISFGGFFIGIPAFLLAVLIYISVYMSHESIVAICVIGGFGTLLCTATFCHAGYAWLFGVLLLTDQEIVNANLPRALRELGQEPAMTPADAAAGINKSDSSMTDFNLSTLV